jgi:pimeloyl-ACP methyl ester carboxylesterase
MKSITHRRRNCFQIVTLLILALVISSGVAAQSKRKPLAPAPGNCTTRTKLYCESYGSGDPILFLHGLGGSTYSWRYMIEPFQGTHQVILIDLRGQGNSPKPKDKKYSILEQRDLIYDFILEHNLRKLTLVGNSYGGAVSLLVTLELIKRDPTRLANLILIDSAAFATPIPLHLQVLRTPIIGWLAVHLIPPKCQSRAVLRSSYYVPDNVSQEQIDMYAKPIADRGGRHALLQLGKQAIPKDFDDYIKLYPTIKVPTLILWGDHDGVLLPDYGEKLNKVLPNSTLVFIKQAGHIPQEEQHEAVVCQMENFLMPGTCPN